MLKVGLIGVGGISGAHIPAWEEMDNAELTALCDIRSEQMAPFPDKRHYTDFEAMLKDEQLDILDICLPTYLHADCIIRAMEQGIHVLCEKPLSLKGADIDRVYDTAAKHNVKFMVAHVLRFWPEYMRIKEIHDSQKYGKMLSGQMTRTSETPRWSWDDWMLDEQRSGFVPFDLHIHDLDFLVYAFGAPQSVKTSRVKSASQDSLSVIYEYGGAFVSAQAAWFASPAPFSTGFRFQFENAVIVFDGQVLTVYERDGGRQEAAVKNQVESGVINLPQTNAYAGEIRYFTECVASGAPADIIKREELKAVVDILESY